MRRGLSSLRITDHGSRIAEGIRGALRLKCTDAEGSGTAVQISDLMGPGGIWSSQRSRQYDHTKGGVTNLAICFFAPKIVPSIRMAYELLRPAYVQLAAASVSFGIA